MGNEKKHKYKEENPHYEELEPEQIRIKDESEYHEQRPEREVTESN